jgi:CRP-like cAMP-binding protein
VDEDREGFLMQFFMTMPFFQGLSTLQQKECVNGLVLAHFDELDTVVRKGAEGRQCYIVLTGHVGTVPIEDDAAGATTGYGPMQFFGEAAVTNEDLVKRKWSEMGLRRPGGQGCF